MNGFSIRLIHLPSLFPMHRNAKSLFKSFWVLLAKSQIPLLITDNFEAFPLLYQFFMKDQSNPPFSSILLNIRRERRCCSPLPGTHPRRALFFFCFRRSMAISNCVPSGTLWSGYGSNSLFGLWKDLVYLFSLDCKTAFAALCRAIPFPLSGPFAVSRFDAKSRCECRFSVGPPLFLSILRRALAARGKRLLPSFPPSGSEPFLSRSFTAQSSFPHFGEGRSNSLF